MKSEDIRPGDRFRAEVTCKHVRSGTGYNEPLFEIDMSTLELIEQAKSPGQKAYEKWDDYKHGDSPRPWESLRDKDRERWEEIAEAARS